MVRKIIRRFFGPTYNRWGWPMSEEADLLDRAHNILMHIRNAHPDLCCDQMINNWWNMFHEARPPCKYDNPPGRR